MIDFRLITTAALVAAASLAVSVLPSFTAQSRSAAPEAIVVRELRPVAGQPSGQPFLALDSKGRVVLSWLEKAGESTRYAFKYAFREGNGWSSPATIVERDNFFVNWADVPSIHRLSGSSSLVAHWLQKNGADTYAYDVRIAVSDSAARGWAPDRLPYRDTTPTEHGFASFFDWPGGGTGIVWLDGREMKSGAHEGHAAAGAMTLRGARIDASGRIADEARLDERVCECCPTAAVATARSALVAYRDRTEGEMRDIAVLRFEDGKWLGPTYVHADRWQINACPVNGPALAANGDRVALAWFTAEGDLPRAMVAFSADGGATFGAPVRVDDKQTLGRVDVAILENGHALVSWLEFAEDGSEFRARAVSPDGSRGPHITVARSSSDRQSGYPRLIRSGNEVIFAWTATRPVPQVKTAVVAWP